MLNVQADTRVHHYDLDETYGLTEGGTIHLDSEDADVKVIASDRKDVRVRVRFHVKKGGLHFGKGYFMTEFEVDERNGDLYMNDVFSNSNNLVFFGYTSTEYDIELEVPHWANLDFDGDDDDYKIEGVTGNISIDAEDGDVAMRKCDSDMKIKLDDGDLYMKYCEGRAKIRMADGNLEIAKGKFDALKVRTADGDMEIETSLSSTGKYDIRTADGDIEFEVLAGGAKFEIDKADGSVSTCSEYEMTEKSHHSREYILGDGEAEVSMVTADGDIDLKAR